jgi:hypothetical protein
MTPTRTAVEQFHPALNISHVVNYPISHPAGNSDKDNSYIIYRHKDQSKPAEKQKPLLKTEKACGKNEDIYLSANTVKKMLLRFLIEKQAPKTKLAEALGITVGDLESFMCSKAKDLISKINLTLIKLYCMLICMQK